MSVVCDVCKIRPASARITFVRDGLPRALDICREDYMRLQSGHPYGEMSADSFFPDFFGSSGSQELSQGYDNLSEATKTVMQQAAEIASRFGKSEISGEHILLALVSVTSITTLLESLNIKTTDIEGYLNANASRDDKKSAQVGMTDITRRVLGVAWEISKELGSAQMEPEHLLVSLAQEDPEIAGDLLRKYGLTSERLRQYLVHRDNELGAGQSATPQLDKYSRDLSAMAREHKLDPLIGRAREIDTTIEILSRRTKNNPVLIGEPGVGKTAIIEGLAQRIESGHVPSTLQDKRVVEVNLNSMVAGTRYRGEFEERIKDVLAEINDHKDELIVFVDELHTIVGAGGGEGGLDASNALKPSLAKGELHLIGATTLNEYQKHIEKDAALERRFQPVVVSEPTKTEAVAIIQGLKERYEEFHGVTIEDAAITSAVDLSDRYITDRFLPDKAIDLIDQAAARVHIRSEAGGGTTVTSEHIAQLISTLTGVPIQELTQAERTKLIDLEKRLHKRVVGQDQAVHAVANAIRTSRAGLSDAKRPIATFLFLGPTGVGKTELAKAVAEAMFGNENLLTRIDMSEYMERHAVSRLIGSPPGYVGYDEGGQLTEAVRRHPYGVILLDEIEKAHPDVLNILLQLLDDGRLTDGKGRTVNFTNTIIIATGNVGSDVYGGSTKIGFESGEPGIEQDLQGRVMEQVGKEFRPEFINRLDEIIVFQALGKKEIQKIVSLQLERVRAAVVVQGIELKWTPGLIKHFAEVGFKPEYGARELKRRIKEELENPLAVQILSGLLQVGTTLRMTYTQKQGVVFSTVA